MSKNFYPFKDTNEVTLSGIIKEDLEFVAEFRGTKIFKTKLGVFRLSGLEDCLPIFISDRLDNFSSLDNGKHIKIKGSMRSSQYRDDNKVKRTRVYVHISDIMEVHNEVPDGWYDNEVTLSGRLFRAPILRKTKTAVLEKTGRKADLAELVLEVHRGYNKYEHIPVIIWGTDAKYISNYDKGTKVSIDGRFQSRNFIRHKRGSTDEYEDAISYEVSARNIEILD